MIRDPGGQGGDPTEAVDAMSAQVQDQEVFELPVINPWRQRPSREQVRFAIDLCRTELDMPQPTIDRIGEMSGYEVSRLIGSLKLMRAGRLRKAPRDRHWRLVL